MQVITLGGAAAWSNPGQGCSSYLVRTGSTSVLIDCGPDTLLELRKHIDFAAIDAIVITHGHSDHILDLVPYRYGLKYGPASPSRPIPLWVPAPTRNVLMALADALGGQGEPAEDFWGSVFDIDTYDPNARLQLDDIQLSFAPTQHFADCYAVRAVSESGSTMTYTSDTGSILSMMDIALDADLLISEATLRDYGDTPENGRGHITPEDAGKLAREAAVSTLVLTHLWSERPDAEVIVAAAREFAGQIFIAKPGETFNV